MSPKSKKLTPEVFLARRLKVIKRRAKALHLVDVALPGDDVDDLPDDAG
jgi:hypothetical protein